MSRYEVDDIINDFNSYEKIINLYAENKDKYFDNIDVYLSGWFYANTCSMLGAVLAKLQNNMNTVTIHAKNSEDILRRNGFLAFFGHEKKPDYFNTTIQYQVLSIDDDRYFNNYVFKEFINKPELPSMTDALKRKLTESIYEIFINAKMHSSTDKIFICGQFFPKKNKIEFMITDIGTGIKNVVNNRFNAELSAVKAIEWSIKDGNTTKQKVSGGIGLSLLHEFIEINKGKFQIISNEGFLELDNGNFIKNNFKNEFPGTMVNISVKTDDTNLYMLNNKINDDIF